MKIICTIVIAAVIFVPLAATANARSFSGPNYMIQFMKDGLKFYHYTKLDNSYSGNWNVRG